MIPIERLREVTRYSIQSADAGDPSGCLDTAIDAQRALLALLDLVSTKQFTPERAEAAIVSVYGTAPTSMLPAPMDRGAASPSAAAIAHERTAAVEYIRLQAGKTDEKHGALALGIVADAIERGEHVPAPPTTADVQQQHGAQPFIEPPHPHAGDIGVSRGAQPVYVIVGRVSGQYLVDRATTRQTDGDTRRPWGGGLPEFSYRLRLAQYFTEQDGEAAIEQARADMTEEAKRYHGDLLLRAYARPFIEPPHPHGVDPSKQ